MPEIGNGNSLVFGLWSLLFALRSSPLALLGSLTNNLNRVTESNGINRVQKETQLQ